MNSNSSSNNTTYGRERTVKRSVYAGVIVSIVILCAILAGMSWWYMQRWIIVRGICLLPDGGPAAGVMVTNFHFTPSNSNTGKAGIVERTKTDANGAFVLKLRPRIGLLIYAKTADNKLAGVAFPQMLPVNAPLLSVLEFDHLGRPVRKGTENPVVCQLETACRVHGRVVSKQLRDPLSEIIFIVRGKDSEDRIISDLAGCKSENQVFEIYLAPGNYSYFVYTPKNREIRPQMGDISVTRDKTELDMGIIDLPMLAWYRLKGKEAPELEIKAWRNTEPLSLKQLSGKVVVLYFWGTWCGPCVYSMPKLIEIHNRYSDKGVVIIAIHDASMSDFQAMDRSLAEIKRLSWNVRDLPFPIALDQGELRLAANDTFRGSTTAAYGIVRFPTVIIIDRNGKIVGSPSRYQIEEMLLPLMGSPF